MDGSAGDACTACGHALRAGARFCDNCGERCATGCPPEAPGGEVLPATFAAGRYRVLRLLGDGGRKRVYLAHDRQLDRDVAIAVFKDDSSAAARETAAAHVRREARAMARLGDHPHIVTVYDIGEEEGRTYIVSQYMGGGDVEGLLQRAPDHRLPVEMAVRIAIDVGAALEHAHRHGVVHRDLKPGNIWLGRDGTAKLGDFGLARAVDRDRLTQEGRMVGTVAYLPPEQALGKAPDARSDLYALGASLYEMVTGRPPFLGDDAVSIVAQHLHASPAAPSLGNAAVPPELDALILHLLAKAPDERPQDAGAVRAALSRIVAAPGPPRPHVRTAVSPLDRLARGVFVGRDEAMGVLRGGFDDACAGRGRLFLLVGEPGIGKTRTAEELCTVAAARNAQVLVGRCYESEGAPAYWPWVQIFRAYLREADPESVRDAVGAGAADIAQLVPEIRERLVEVPAAAVLEPDEARFRLFDSITTFLRGVAAHRPLVLVLDDLHWADKPSLLLLQFLARELRDGHILVLGTYRDIEVRRQHPLAQTLAELAREQLSERVLLRGIAPQDIATFIERAAGRTPTPELVNAVYRETEGNPFFVKEIVRLLVADGRLDTPAGGADTDLVLSVPQSVREVIGRRLDRLSERTNQLLTTAAVIGREFALPALQRVSGWSADAVLEGLEDAVAARILYEDSRAVGWYGFTHALVRETLYGELSTTRRVRLHRQTAEVLEELYAVDPEPHLAELAHHFFEAAPAGEATKAIDYALRAGARASAQLAYEEAVVQYDRALQAMELFDQPDLTRLCDVRMQLGNAHRAVGDAARAREAFAEAARLARQIDDPERFTRAVLGFSDEGIELGRVDEEARALLEEAAARLPPADGALRAGLLARLANSLYWSDQRWRSSVLSEEAVAVARRVGDPGVLARALLARRYAFWDPRAGAQSESLLSFGTEILRFATEAGDAAMLLGGHEWRIMAYLQLGDIAAVDREIAVHARLSEELRLPIHRWLTMSWKAMRALLDGRFDEAERLGAQAVSIGQRIRPVAALGAFQVQAVLRLLHLGRFAEVEPMLQRIVADYPHMPVWRCALAAVWAGLGRRDEVQAEFERLAVKDFADVPLDVVWAEAVVLLADVCAYLEDRRRAAVLYDMLLPLGASNVVVGFGVASLGSAARVLGGLAAVLGRDEEAAAHFEAAVAMHTRMGARPLLAETLVDYAEFVSARDGVDAAPRVLALANRALEVGAPMGMQPVVERATALKMQAEGVDAVDIKTSIDAVMSAVRARRPVLDDHLATDGTVTLLFSDMEGFSEMTERLGDHRAHRVIRIHNALVRRQIDAHGGLELELQGDGFLVAFADPAAAVGCAVAIQRAFAAHSARPGTEPIRVRMGLHTGEAIADADRFFGKTVILAARVAAQARGGEVLVSGVVRERLEARGVDLEYGPTREVTLKGLAGTHRVSTVTWEPRTGREGERVDGIGDDGANGANQLRKVRRVPSSP